MISDNVTSIHNKDGHLPYSYEITPEPYNWKHLQLNSINLFNDDKTKSFYCSVGNFQILFPEMWQDLWGTIIPACGIWLLKTPFK